MSSEALQALAYAVAVFVGGCLSFGITWWLCKVTTERRAPQGRR